MSWSQRWSDVLFVHYPAAVAELEPQLPPGIELDLLDGRPWISFVFFRLHVRPAWLPAVPGLSSLLELNLRTYVRCSGQSGIYFLSMHANNRLAIGVARLLTPLNYQSARMSYESDRDGWRVAKCSSQTNSEARFSVRFRTAGLPQPAIAGSLAAWLAERYRLFVGSKGGDVIAADVEHPPWDISPVTAEVKDDSLAAARGLSLEANAIAHYSAGVIARFGSFRKFLAGATDHNAGTIVVRPHPAAVASTLSQRERD